MVFSLLSVPLSLSPPSLKLFLVFSCLLLYVLVTETYDMNFLLMNNFCLACGTVKLMEWHGQREGNDFFFILHEFATSVSSDLEMIYWVMI